MTLEQIKPRSQKHLSDRLRGLIRGRLWLQVLIGLALGVGAGIALGPSVGWVKPALATSIGQWLALPGQMFLGVIQMIVVPLILASVVRGLASSEDLDQLRKVGVRAMAFFVVTTLLAAAIGIALALIVRPGDFIDRDMLKNLRPEPVATAAGELPQPIGGVPVSGEAISGSSGNSGENPGGAGATPVSPTTQTGLPSRVLGLLPQNPLASMVEREMLQIVIFSIIVGVALVTMAPKQAKPLLELLGSIQEVCITVVRWAMTLAPVAVFGLMAQVTSKIGLGALLGMGVYVGTVLFGLLIMMGIYLIIVFTFAGKRPLPFLRSVREVLLLAFSTSSSAAVMPLSIRTADEKLGVRPSISQFVIPFGATVNMNGTALYQSVATLFLAQLFGVDLNLSSLIFVVVIAVASSIGAPATPGVGMVILATLLQGVGVPLSGIALVMGVDRILDMSRTSVNVCGDLVACVVLDRWVGGSSTAEEELANEAKLDARRAASGEDVIVSRVVASTAHPSDDRAP